MRGNLTLLTKAARVIKGADSVPDSERLYHQAFSGSCPAWASIVLVSSGRSYARSLPCSLLTLLSPDTALSLPCSLLTQLSPRRGHTRAALKQHRSGTTAEAEAGERDGQGDGEGEGEGGMGVEGRRTFKDLYMRRCGVPLRPSESVGRCEQGLW